MNKTDETKLLLKKVMDPQDAPDRVPLYLNLQGWIVYHGAGYGYLESVFDSDTLLSAYKKAMTDYPADLYYDTGGFAFMGFSKLLGSQDFFLNEEKYSLNFKDVCYLSEDEEFESLAKDPQDFLWNSFYRKKFKNLQSAGAPETLKEYLSLSNAHFEKVAAMKAEIEEQNGSLFLSDVPMYQPAFDYLFQYIIGMKGISMAMRRRKQQLAAALEGFEGLFTRYMDTLTPPPGQDMPFRNQICLLGQAITNRAQFEPYIWNSLGSRIERFAENNGKFYFMVEGAAGVLADYLDRIPRGSCALHVEKDSLEDLTGRFGDRFTYVGGFPVELMGSGSMDECRAFARKLLECYGHKGNYIFSTDKGINFETDAKPDNLNAVCEEVRNFHP